MKNRMRYMVLALTGAMAMTLSCQSEDLLIPEFPEMHSDYVTVEFNTSVPAMDVLQTKAVDPDGEAITKLVLFNFNDKGLFISSKEAAAGATSDYTGTFSVELPVVTDRVHIVANFHKEIDESEFVGKSESEVLSTMVGSSGMMSYWARVTRGTHANIKQAFEAEYQTVHLLRDHARITVTDKEMLYSDLAFLAVNTNAFGTVAPFNNGLWAAPSMSNMFVTLPESDAKVSGDEDVVSVDKRKYQYVFETENSSSDPVSVIIKGTRNGQAKYYRVMLIDNNGDYVPVMRNFTYDVNIEGVLDYGQDTFDAALTTPASNNVWVSVSDQVNEVSNADYSLSVAKSSIVLGESDDVFLTTHQKYTVSYTLKSLNGSSLTSSDEPQIKWLDGNNVAQHTFEATSFTISPDGKTAEGKVEIILFRPDTNHQKREGTLLIRKGLLERKVNIVTVVNQNFTPAWITTNVYGGATGSDVTMMFHVSEDCPQTLFPIEVLVSVNDMDVRNESGMVLPVITPSDAERYGEDNGIGYKYVLTVTEPGDQRLYLETILNHTSSDQVVIKIEAKHFNSLTRTATFQNEVDARILIHNLRSYAASTPADEYIYYYVVPQKVNAEVEFDTHLGKVVNNPSAADVTLSDPNGNPTYFQYIAPNVDYTAPNVDEFLLYSQNLEHNHDKPAGTTYYFDFYKLDPSVWSPTAGRVLGFYRNSNPGEGTGATFHLRTTKAKSDEVVRIATNPYGQPSITRGTRGEFAKEAYQSDLCTGTGLYKSCIFELTTFHPFHFSAQVKQGSNVVGGEEDGKTAPANEKIYLSYEPGQRMDVEFDITSFKSDLVNTPDNEQLSVDPFGTSFEVYIDAPTLELDEAAVAAAGLAFKIKKDPNVKGRVIYTVDSSREVERGYFNIPALSNDGAVLDLFRKPIEGGSVNQTGERKSIPFKTKEIVSAGDIKISSDESKVVYFSKTFTVQNTSIEGTLTYGSSSIPVPSGTFVPFSTDDGTRIGVVSVGDNGAFELRLRAEYQFTWESTPVKFEAKVGATEYKAEFTSLKALVSSLGSPIQMN